MSRPSADQRAGRAGRTAPGICWRLWDEASHHHRPAAETPEILRGDLAGTLLQLLALGERGGFPWLDPPPAEATEQARTLLRRLGALEPANDGQPERLTGLGRDLVRLPAHPRLARLLLAGAAHGVLREASIAAALLSERDPFRAVGHARPGPRDRLNVRTRSDVVDRVVALQAFHEGIRFDDADLELHPGGARSVLRTAEQLYRLVDVALAPRAAEPAAALMRALLEAFPDRLARLRPGAADRGSMVGGRGVRLDGGSRVRHVSRDRPRRRRGRGAGPAGFGRGAGVARGGPARGGQPADRRRARLRAGPSAGGGPPSHALDRPRAGGVAHADHESGGGRGTPRAGGGRRARLRAARGRLGSRPAPRPGALAGRDAPRSRAAPLRRRRTRQPASRSVPRPAVARRRARGGLADPHPGARRVRPPR
ncbi:MAG: hypothetical protein EBZ74_00790 [Planctomycetia bacterium]|nr:hypothetical protein [Planctomycetia bacterium]